MTRSILRVVEAQHKNSTRKLVDTDDEQAILEIEIESAKPPVPSHVDQNLHYLLWTPFRYPPLEHGSRFGSTTEPSLWYGSLEVRTAFAEKAYHRWKFLVDSEGDFGPLQVELSLFSVGVGSRKVADLDSPLFAKFQNLICAKNSYSESQALGTKLRQAGVEMIKYRSARDPEQGPNFALYSSRVFKDKIPKWIQSWTLLMEKEGSEASFRPHPSLKNVPVIFTKSEVGV